MKYFKAQVYRTFYKLPLNMFTTRGKKEKKMENTLIMGIRTVVRITKPDSTVFLKS